MFVISEIYTFAILPESKKYTQGPPPCSRLLKTPAEKMELWISKKLFHLDVRHHTLEVFTAVGELPAPNGQVVANIPANLVSHLTLILQLGSAPPLEGILL